MTITTSPLSLSPAQRIRAALVTLNRAGPCLCEMLRAKHGTSQAAAKACGISEVHFCKLRSGLARASWRMLERMSFEVEAKS